MEPSSGRITLLIRPQGSRRIYSEHLEAHAPLRPQLQQFLAQQFNVAPRYFVASAAMSRSLLDLDCTPAELGLQPGEVIRINWTTSMRGETILEVAPSILAQTNRVLRKGTLYGVETLCYWAGVWEDDRWKITAVMRPRPIVATSARVDVSAEENRRIERMLPARNWIVAQVHSHMGPAFHSRWDERYPFSMEPGFLSVVVPAHADVGSVWTSGVRIFELVRHPRWREWDREEIRRRLKLTEGWVNTRYHMEGRRRTAAPGEKKRRPYARGGRAQAEPEPTDYFAH